MEGVESELIRSEAKVKELEMKLRNCTHSEDFLQSQQQKVMKYDEMERKVEQLLEENDALKRQQDNTDLLRYKVQTLQARCAKYEGLDERVATLELENQGLKEKLDGRGLQEGEDGQKMAAVDIGKSPATLWYKIAELQQREVLLKAKLGEVMTRFVPPPPSPKELRIIALS